MIKKVIPEIQFRSGTGGFAVPKGYRFVRRLPNQFASEYYLFPFHLPARLYWKAMYGAYGNIFRLIRWYVKKRRIHKKV